MQSGISIREQEVRNWLKDLNFEGEYLLISTKPDSVYSKKLAALKTDQKLIVDLYTPIFLEKELTLSRWKPQDWLTRFRNEEAIKRFLRRGNHFLVANRRQREYWLNESKNLSVPLKETDITVLPTGAGRVLSTNGHQLPAADHHVILWFGGIYPWLDPGPLIDAFSEIAPIFPQWKLRVLGGWYPGTGYGKRYQRIVREAKQKISGRQLEIISWQAPDTVRKYLQDVSFSVHLVRKTDEDFYSHRVRLLTVLNAGIPVLTSGVDVISQLLIENHAGERIGLNSSEIADKLAEVINCTELAKRWSKNAQKIEKIYIKQEQT